MIRYTPLAFSVIVTGVGQAIMDEVLEGTGGGPEVKRVCLLVPGAIAWDDCQCGQFAQTITSVFPANTFPTPATETAQTSCGPSLIVANVTASLTRCITGVSADGKPPRCATLGNEAIRLEKDRYAMRYAARCFLKSLRDAYEIIDYAIGTVTSVGPEGICGGVELTYSIGIAAGDCCE